MLGVATLIVVNSVMSGFSTKLKDRLHGLLSDALIEARSSDGFPDPDEKMRRIRESPIGDKIEAMTPTLETFAMLQFNYRGEMFTRPVHLIGIEPEGRGRVGGFVQHLLRQKDSPHPSFELTPEARQRQMLRTRPMFLSMNAGEAPRGPNDPPPPEPPPSRVKIPEGVIVGNAVASYRDHRSGSALGVKDVYVLEPGDDVLITTVSGQKLAPVYDRFTVCDYFKSE